MPRIDLDILNQKQTPAFYASSLATRPAASFVGRIFIDSDNPSTGLYRDTGTAWVQIADPGAGTTGTLQQVTTNGSSTTVGISTSGNGIGIGTTIPASNKLDIHSSSGINATFNGTGTTNAALQFQLAGTGKWNVGNLYNSNSNDFIITDVVNTLNRVTVKNTGQTFIGADTTSSGLLVVNNASSDAHIVVLGANSPSIRIRDSGSSLIQNVGLGISTGTNAFIQGSASGNYCIFNSSTTASPILFGVYDAGTGNTQEAIRISAARNLLVGTATDGGFKLSISGTANISGALSGTSATFSDTFQINKAGGLALRAYYGSGNNLPLDVNIDGSNGDASLTFNTTYNSGWKYFINNFAARISNAGTLKFQVASNGTAGNTISWVDALAFNNSTGDATFSSSVTASSFTAGGAGSGGSGTLTIRNDGGIPASIANEAASGTLIRFSGNGSGVLGSISHNGSITLYNTTSDYRLKQDLKDYNGLNLICAIKTYDYEWKFNKTRMYGVIAHELEKVLPYSVTGKKDAEEMQSVDYSKIVPILIKAIQELNDKINALKI